MKTKINDSFKESLRQKTQIENTINYLKETDPSCICLKSEGVIPVNQVWVTSLNLSLIDLQPLLDEIKSLTINHLNKQLNELNKKHDIKKKRRIFINQ